MPGRPFVVRRACSAASGWKSRPNLVDVKGCDAPELDLRPAASDQRAKSVSLVVNPAVAYRKQSDLSREICCLSPIRDCA